jgi:hypothetical protein
MLHRILLTYVPYGFIGTATQHNRGSLTLRHFRTVAAAVAGDN